MPVFYYKINIVNSNLKGYFVVKYKVQTLVLKQLKLRFCIQIQFIRIKVKISPKTAQIFNQKKY